VNIADVFPPKEHVQRLYCSDCSEPLDLAYVDFHEDVSGVNITIIGLPVLRCLPDSNPSLSTVEPVSVSSANSCRETVWRGRPREKRITHFSNLGQA
jgi:hypothetical protein